MVFGQSQIYLNILADMRLMRHGSKKNWGSTLGTDLHISFFSLNILFDWRFNLSTNNNINLYERFDEISPSNGSWLISYILNRPPSMLKITSVHARKKQKISISRLFSFQILAHWSVNLWTHMDIIKVFERFDDVSLIQRNLGLWDIK